MQAVVKTPLTEIIINGTVSDSILNMLRQEYGSDLRVIEDDIFETEWYRNIKNNMKPGDYIRAYRRKRGWTQATLGAELGGVPKQHISNMERGTRPVSLKMARKLSDLFGVGINLFLMGHYVR